jgi:hypothetical protein
VIAAIDLDQLTQTRAARPDRPRKAT